MYVVFSLPPPPQLIGPLEPKQPKGEDKLLVGKIQGPESIVVENSKF